ncbi:TLC domain-containing protein 4-B-like [Anguilla anguilla]|uniref:TLC domain-containing protein 4-B-like n=1 Tax=Anguilla anguilla TaxID=7936 RepID=UPI0015B19BCE|nr:TLC domain-containing protein 4-B-like [Anguilla anguilla]XP_035278580.1 TLC domain-containing protein 4-B-like [Anguilla anguilla]XP_035278581.1 TLC domain-containing protein 4-B-like [Anguilla anguilla]XP_035278582.1 TLC domain-containing protein 4-B-like [Anguilla anguilla]XP_035278583.1 TLC domain-containing protein 4-B-like [Anguilla anguilla]XP_035278584.1 TLC domain-containing protein 4-B-like [Anguilla anguilla]
MDPFNQLILTLMVLSFLAFQGLFHAVSPWASSHVSSGFRQLSRKQKIEWNSRTVSTLHALVVGVFCFYILVFDDAINLDPVWGDATLVKINVAITTGYLISDLLLILYFWDAIGDKLFIVHHLAALYAYYYVLGKGMLPYFANFRQLAEFSTPCVNQRWLFEVLGYPKSSKPNLANGVLMATTFFLVRIMVMPVYYGRMYSVLGMQAIYRVSLGGRIAWILSSFCLDVMNLMWMHKIARGCFKVLHSGQRPKLQTYVNRKVE